jgi:hypothetical protein
LGCFVFRSIILLLLILSSVTTLLHPHPPLSLSILYTVLLCPTPAARGTELKRSGCGSSNIRQGQAEDARCRLPEQHNVSLPDLLEQTEYWQVRSIVSCLFLLKNMFVLKTTVMCLVLTYQLLVLIAFIVIIVIIVISPSYRCFIITVRQNRYDALFAFLQRDPVLRRLPRLEVHYEDLQRDKVAVMQVRCGVGRNTLCYC